MQKRKQMKIIRNALSIDDELRVHLPCYYNVLLYMPGCD
jgi:hypothetical protein